LFDRIFNCCAVNEEKKENKIRSFFRKIVVNKVFDGVIIAAIIISSLALAFENPLNDPNGNL